MATHKVESMGYPMPALRRAPSGPGRRLPGGLPPQTNRSATHKWVGGSKSAREPYASTAIRLEVAITQKWLRA